MKKKVVRLENFNKEKLSNEKTFKVQGGGYGVSGKLIYIRVCKNSSYDCFCQWFAFQEPDMSV